jgi:2'-5' RNA ligase
MPRQRLGVALLVPGPAAAEIDGLRRALGDGALGRIPAHLTLVPPVNVPVERVPEALAVLRVAGAAIGGPLRLRLGPAATFDPVTPVVYLAVEGEIDRVVALRDHVFRPPLQRVLTHPFVPHVTLVDDMAPARIPVVIRALADACLDVTVDRVHLLREEAGRTWRPIADAPLAPAVVVGRGGLPLELTTSEHPDPESARLLAWSRPDPRSPGGEAGGPAGAVAVAARRDGELVGVALGWSVGPLTRLAELVVAEGARRQGVGGHLLAAFERVARDRESGALEAVAPDDPAATALLSGAGWIVAGSPHAGWRWWTRPLT